jgi:hypothetical protein
MKRIPLTLSFLVFFAAISQLTFAQSDNSGLKNVVAKLKAYTASHVIEKAYLHLDKPYYAAGDTIYLKAYITQGERHQPSAISGILHVDLINTQNKTDQSIKLLLSGGTGSGDFALPDSLPEGNYRIRAYTRWMRNDADYFEQIIPVGSAIDKKIPESNTKNIAAAINKPDLQFFPEGGEMVAGIKAKVAFKAIGANGLGIDIKGTITDNTGKEVGAFNSSHLGMGYFELLPEDGKTYRAKITYADGVETVSDLPGVSAKGVAMQIRNDSLDKAPVHIIANAAYFKENRNRNFYLLIYSGGVATTITAKLDTAVIDLAIVKRHLHTGITKVTLFTDTGEPVCERLLFIENADHLNLKLTTDKADYKPREKVKLNLRSFSSTDSVTSGNFSVSVIDESKVKVDENSESTIINNLLLTSELKGTIEQPNYYFTNVNDQTRADLDLVMLTHGYRRFAWKALLNNEYPPVAYQPEKYLQIDGVAKGALGSALVKGTVSLISASNGVIAIAQTDSKGGFSFSNLMFTDTGKFVLQAINKKGSNKTELIYKPETSPEIKPLSLLNKDVNKNMTAYLENNKKQLNEYNIYGKAKGKMLEEVKIKYKKLDNKYASSVLGGPGHANQVIHSKDIENQGGQFSQVLAGLLNGVTFVPSGFGHTPVKLGYGVLKVLMDGIAVNIDDINSNDVETVELLYGANASIYGMFSGPGGLLVITTKQGTGKNAKDIASIGVLPIKVNGFYKAREFYAPKYEHEKFDVKRKDLRSIIYWNPEVMTGNNGNTTLEFYNADGKGSYRVVVEGMDANGNLGRQVYRYNVE